MKKIDTVNFRKVNRDSLIIGLKSSYYITPSREEFKLIFKGIESAFLNGDYLVARNKLLVALYFDGKRTVEFIQKKGLFRYSKYVNKKCMVKSLASELIEAGKDLGVISTDEISYFESIVNFSSVLDSYNHIDQSILRELKAFERNYKGKSLIKTLLVVADYLFLSNHERENGNYLSNISNRTKEEISAAISFLIFFYTERMHKDKPAISRISEHYIRTGGVERLVISACAYLDFREFEILIDAFQYKCSADDTGLTIQPPFEDFEKVIRMGYIRSELQIKIDRVDFDDALSLEELIYQLTDQNVFKFVVKTDTYDYPRYRLEVPEPFYDYIIVNFIKPDSLFKEEIIYLSSVFKEQLLNPKELNLIRIKNDLTLFDFIKIRRVFIFYYLMFAKELYKQENIDTDVLLRSLIPMFENDHYYQMMEKLFPSDKIDAFLDVVCWEPGVNFVFDLQYHPVLFLSKHFIVPLSIFSNSNAIRNLYASQYKLANSSLLNSGENLVAVLKDIFIKVGLPYFTDLSIASTDIDVCALFDDTLFVFECKQTLHPVSPFDMRTTFNYIRKAETQLQKIESSFKSGHLQKLLASKLDVSRHGIGKIVSCIILSNRIFNGNIFKHPVRNIHEVQNMLTKGTIRTEDGMFNLWGNTQLTKEFMIEYFSLTSQLHTLLMSLLSKTVLDYDHQGSHIKFDSWCLDLEIALPKIRQFTSNYEKTDED